MNKKTLFVHKLIDKLDKIDPQALKAYVCDLADSQSIFRSIMNEIEDGILLIDSDKSILFDNTAAQTILGIPFKDQDKKKGLEDIQDDEFRSFIEEVISDFNENLTEDFTVLIPKEMQLRVHIRAINDTTHNATLVILKDISQFKAPQDWEDKIARIESLVKLAAGVAHEIGNPLNSISIHMQMLNKMVDKLPANDQKALRETVDVITAETNRLDRIIRHFLKATRKPPIRFKVEDLNAVLQESVQFLMPELEANNVKVEFEPDSELPSFMLDRERLHQSFINLIKNANEAMPEGGKLKITVTHKAKLAKIEFKDEGTGIAEEDLPHIFDAYFTTKTEGHGLGLMTVFDAVRDHGGRVEAASQIGKGTTLSLLIPIRQPKLQLPNSKNPMEEE